MQGGELLNTELWDIDTLLDRVRLNVPRQVSTHLTENEVLGVLAAVFGHLGVVQNREQNLSNDDVRTILKYIRCPVNFTKSTLSPRNLESNGAQVTFVIKWLAELIDLEQNSIQLSKIQELKQHVLFDQCMRSYEHFLQGNDNDCSIIHRGHLQKIQELNITYKRKMDGVHIENSSLHSLLDVDSGRLLGVDLKRSKEYELQTLARECERKTKLWSDKVADNTSKLSYSRRRISVMKHTHQEKLNLERVNLVQDMRNVGYVANLTSSVSSTLTDLNLVLQLVSQLSNQYRKLVAYLMSICGPELRSEFAVLSENNSGIPKCEALFTVRQLRELISLKTREIINLTPKQDAQRSSVINTYTQRLNLCSTMAAELDACESLYESERNKINVTVSDLKSELNQVEMQLPKEDFRNCSDEAIARKEAIFAQKQGLCSQEKSTMQQDVLLALDDMMSHKQNVHGFLDNAKHE